MTNITIPPEALEAAYEAFLITDGIRGASFEDCIRAACLAMLNAWPGAEVLNLDNYEYAEGIILPLPQEKPHD